MSLKRDDIKGYWDRRSKAQQRRTVGYGGIKTPKQDVNYVIRKKFILDKIDLTAYTLDYGCGIGRYSENFPHYVGVDITERLLKYAQEDNPNKHFIHTPTPYLEDIQLPDVEQIFTATVLQHNSDAMVECILRSFRDKYPNLKTLILYENSHPKLGGAHVKGRSPAEYEKIVRELFNVKEVDVYTHNLCKQDHSLSIFHLQDERGDEA